MEIMKLMEERHSVRQYTDQKIEEEKRKILTDLCEKINAENDMHMQVIYDEPTCFTGMMARYGKFSGVTDYIAVVGPKGADLDEKAGYCGEQLVLKAQELGLNTCWVALTHGKSKAKVEKGEKQAILLSLGYGVNQGSAHQSKDISKLAKVNGDAPQWYLDGIKAAMLAPTAMNQQKFTIEQAGEQAKITAAAGMYTKLDLGIVKYHFEAASGHKTV